MKPMLWSTLILSLATFPLGAQADPGRGPRAERMARTLNLTEAQRSNIQAIREKHRPDLILRRDAIQQAQAALRAALQDATTPEVQLRNLYDKASAARFDLMLARRSVHLETQAVLTPEQRIKAAEMRGAAQARMHERMHHLRTAAGRTD